LIILTLGLFALVVNGLLLWLRAVGVAWPRLSRERLLGGSFWVADGEHRQHGALGFHRARIDALRSGNGAVVVASSPYAAGCRTSPVRPI
jgi:hypothetical protein